MILNKKILTIIPARGGSKRLPGKNIKLLAGKPMIAYAIEAARKSKYTDNIIVTTDDQKIADIAAKYGADVPFIRPTELATDEAKSIDVIIHAVDFFETQKGFLIDLIILIQPTSPLVISTDVDAVIEKILQAETKSCATVFKVTQRPEWMYVIHQGESKPFLTAHNTDLPSQELKELYCLNGAVYAMRRDTVMKDRLVIDNKSFSTVIIPRERSVDVDELYDFELAEAILKNHANKTR